VAGSRGTKIHPAFDIGLGNSEQILGQGIGVIMKVVCVHLKTHAVRRTHLLAFKVSDDGIPHRRLEQPQHEIVAVVMKLALRNLLHWPTTPDDSHMNRPAQIANQSALSVRSVIENGGQERN
jgi:hypothetical protein